MTERMHRTIALTITSIYWAGMFIATHLPPTRVPRTRVSDKVTHFTAYAILAGLLLWSLRQIGFSPRAAAWLVVTIALIYAALDEYLQIFVGRICSMSDWLANAAGVIAVAAVAVVIGALRDVRET